MYEHLAPNLIISILVRVIIIASRHYKPLLVTPSPASQYLTDNSFMNKNLSKAIMLRTKLRNIFYKNRTEENKYRYTKQRNLCVTLLRKIKREYFNNLNEKNVCDNKKFWRVVKPLLSNKIISNEKITIVEGDKIIRSDNETAKV